MSREGRPWIGDQVRDTRTNRVGVVTDVQDGTYVLRPQRRGRTHGHTDDINGNPGASIAT